MKKTLLAALAIAALGASSDGYAHGGLSINEGQCIMKIGPDTMQFTGLQPIKSREAFCDDIPDVGSTIIVLDAQQDELREMTLEIRILRNVGQKDDNENFGANTELYIPPKKYKTGTLNFEYNFAKEGNYIGLVTAKSDDGTKVYTSRFPFAVGQTAIKEQDWDWNQMYEACIEATRALSSKNAQFNLGPKFAPALCGCMQENLQKTPSSERDAKFEGIKNSCMQSVANLSQLDADSWPAAGINLLRTVCFEKPQPYVPKESRDAYCTCYISIVPKNVSWQDYLLIDSAITAKGVQNLDPEEKYIFGRMLAAANYCIQKNVRQAGDKVRSPWK
jgi:hypothetical protein